MNRFVWNLRYPDATSFPGLIMWAGSVTGPPASPGTYQVRLTVDGKSQTQPFEVKKDPRLRRPRPKSMPGSSVAGAADS